MEWESDCGWVSTVGLETALKSAFGGLEWMSVRSPWWSVVGGLCDIDDGANGAAAWSCGWTVRVCAGGCWVRYAVDLGLLCAGFGVCWDGCGLDWPCAVSWLRRDERVNRAALNAVRGVWVGVFVRDGRVSKRWCWKWSGHERLVCGGSFWDGLAWTGG